MPPSAFPHPASTPGGLARSPGETAEDRGLLAQIRQAHGESGGRYGSPRVHAALRARGRRVGRGRVERLMRRHGVRALLARPRRVRTTDSRHPFPVAPNLLGRQFMAAAPNQVWLADITWILLAKSGRRQSGPNYVRLRLRHLGTFR